MVSRVTNISAYFGLDDANIYYGAFLSPHVHHFDDSSANFNAFFLFM